MVKTITMRFNDDVFKKLQIIKIRMGVKKHLSISWEEFMMYLCKLQ